MTWRGQSAAVGLCCKEILLKRAASVCQSVCVFPIPLREPNESSWHATEVATPMHTNMRFDVDLTRLALTFYFVVRHELLQSSTTLLPLVMSLLLQSYTPVRCKWGWYVQNKQKASISQTSNSNGSIQLDTRRDDY
jgi:hypothetical protein